jgi:hypothetical protein
MSLVVNKVKGLYDISFDKSNTEALQEQVNQGRYPEDLVGEYLEGNGNGILARAGHEEDVFNPGGSPFINGDIVSDGAWIWSRELAYYAKKYKIPFLQKFLRHMERNGWKVPPLSPEQIAAIGNILRAE